MAARHTAHDYLDVSGFTGKGFPSLVGALARQDGPAAVADFLEPFLAGEPPFVLSDEFLAGLLPRPMLPFEGRAAKGG